MSSSPLPGKCGAAAHWAWRLSTQKRACVHGALAPAPLSAGAEVGRATPSWSLGHLGTWGQVGERTVAWDQRTEFGSCASGWGHGGQAPRGL